MYSSEEEIERKNEVYDRAKGIIYAKMQATDWKIEPLNKYKSINYRLSNLDKTKSIVIYDDKAIFFGQGKTPYIVEGDFTMIHMEQVNLMDFELD